MPNQTQTRAKKPLAVAPVAPASPKPENLPAPIKEEPMLTKADRFPLIAGVMARLYAGIIPGIGDTFDLTKTADTFRFLSLCENDAQVVMQKQLPVITYQDKDGVRFFEGVDVEAGEGYGNYMARVNRKAGRIAKVNGEAHILSSVNAFEALAYDKASALEADGDTEKQKEALGLAYRDRSVLMAVRRDSAYVQSTDGAMYKMAQVLNLPKPEKKRDAPKRRTAEERTTAYRGELLAIAKKGAELILNQKDGDNPAAFWQDKKVTEAIDKANNHFRKEYKRIWPLADLQALSDRIVRGEEVDALV